MCLCVCVLPVRFQDVLLVSSLLTLLTFRIIFKHRLPRRKGNRLSNVIYYHIVSVCFMPQRKEVWKRSSDRDVPVGWVDRSIPSHTVWRVDWVCWKIKKNRDKKEIGLLPAERKMIVAVKTMLVALLTSDHNRRSHSLPFATFYYIAQCTTLCRVKSNKM